MKNAFCCRLVCVLVIAGLNTAYLYAYGTGSEEGWLFLVYILSLLLLPLVFHPSFPLIGTCVVCGASRRYDQSKLSGLWFPSGGSRWPFVGRRYWGEAIACLFVLGLGVFLRVWRWEEVPPGIWIDEILAARNGMRILDGVSAPVFGSMPLSPERPDWVHTFNLYSYWVAGILKVFGGGDFGIKMISIVPGCLTLVGFYWLLRELGGARTAVIGTLMLVMSRWHLTQSRFEWDVTFLVMGGVLSLAATARGLRTGRTQWTALGGILCGLIQFSYIGSRFVAVGMIGWLLLLILMGQKRRYGARQRAVMGLMIWCLSFVVAAGPVIVFSIVNTEIAWVRVREVGFWSDPRGIAEFMGWKLWRYLGMFFVEGPANARLNIPREPLLLYPVSFLAAMGAAVHLFFRRGLAHGMTWMMFVCVLAGAVPAEGASVSSHRTAMTLPIVYLWVAHALELCIRVLSCARSSLSDNDGLSKSAGFAFLLLIIVGMSSVTDTYDYFVTYGRSEATRQWMGRVRERHLSIELQPYLESHEIWIDRSFHDLTLGVLLWRPKRKENGVTVGGLSNPAFSIWKNPERLLEISRDAKGPLVIAVDLRHREKFAKYLPHAEQRVIKDRWGRSLFVVFVIGSDHLE